MELQTRPVPRRVPTWHKLAGLGESNINPTTIWTPQTGYLNTPGTLADGYQWQPQVYSVYDVPGLLLSAPDCVQASGGAFVSAECVDQALAIQQENFRRTAAYNAGQAVPGVTRPTWETFTPTGSGASGGGGQAQGFSFTNLTSGDNTNFRVGDRWQIVITGPANAPVAMNGGLNGANSLYQMGSTDSSGRFTANGQMTQGEVGNWIEAWRINNQIIASLSFRVLPADSVQTATGGGSTVPQTTGTIPRTTTTAGSTGGGQTVNTTFQSVLDSLPGGSVDIGGSSIPILALGIGAVVLLMVLKR